MKTLKYHPHSKSTEILGHKRSFDAETKGFMTSAEWTPIGHLKTDKYAIKKIAQLGHFAHDPYLPGLCNIMVDAENKKLVATNKASMLSVAADKVIGLQTESFYLPDPALLVKSMKIAKGENIPLYIHGNIVRVGDFFMSEVAEYNPPDIKRVENAAENSKSVFNVILPSETTKRLKKLHKTNSGFIIAKFVKNKIQIIDYIEVIEELPVEGHGALHEFVLDLDELYNVCSTGEAVVIYLRAKIELGPFVFEVGDAKGVIMPCV